MHVHFGGVDSLKIVLVVIAVQGALNLLAMRFKSTSSFWASYANLFGIS